MLSFYLSKLTHKNFGLVGSQFFLPPEAKKTFGKSRDRNRVLLLHKPLRQPLNHGSLYKISENAIEKTWQVLTNGVGKSSSVQQVPEVAIVGAEIQDGVPDAGSRKGLEGEGENCLEKRNSSQHQGKYWFDPPITIHITKSDLASQFCRSAI